MVLQKKSKMTKREKFPLNVWSTVKIIAARCIKAYCSYVASINPILTTVTEKETIIGKVFDLDEDGIMFIFYLGLPCINVLKHYHTW